MFGCCNTIWNGFCRCGRRSCCGCSGNAPVTPMPIFPPVDPPAPQAQLRGAEFALSGSAGTVLPNLSAVPFNVTVSNDSRGISSAIGGGNVTINRPGTYLLNWWVAIGDGGVEVSGESGQSAGGDGVAFTVMQNGTRVSSAYASGGAGQISGSTLLKITSAMTTVNLINESGCPITLASDTNGQAGMTITQLA